MEGDDVKREVKAFVAIREIHKAGGKKTSKGYVMSPGIIHRIQRTPEEQAAHDADLLRDSKLFSMSADGLKFTDNKKPKGSQSAITKSIHKLANNNRSLSAKELYAIANKKITDSVNLKQFQSHVTNARKLNQKVKKQPAK